MYQYMLVPNLGPLYKRIICFPLRGNFCRGDRVLAVDRLVVLYLIYGTLVLYSCDSETPLNDKLSTKKTPSFG